MNQNPDHPALDDTDFTIQGSGWIIQDNLPINLKISIGMPIRRYQIDIDHADYVPIANKIPVVIIDAKRHEGGNRLIVHENQSRNYRLAKLKFCNDPLPFVNDRGILSGLRIIGMTNQHQSLAFTFHSPETFSKWSTQDKSLANKITEEPSYTKNRLKRFAILAIKHKTTGCIGESNTELYA